MGNKNFSPTPKQLEILLLLYRFRFLNSPQIQAILNHKYHHRIQTWLNDLLTKDYIGQLYVFKQVWKKHYCRHFIKRTHFLLVSSMEIAIDTNSFYYVL